MVLNLCMIEPRLVDFSGHLYNYALSLKREIEGRGGVFCILVSVDCSEDIISSLNGIPVFATNPANSWFKNLWFRFFLVPIVFNYHLYQGLTKFRSQNSGQWHFFMGTTQYFDLFALFLFNIGMSSHTCLFLTARMTNYRVDINRWSLSVVWYRFFFFILFLQNRIKGNVVIITDSDTLKVEYQKLTRMKVHLLPIPHTTNFFEISSSNLVEASDLVVVSLGPARSQKGFSQIEKLVRIYSSIKADFPCSLKFHLQCSAIQDLETEEALRRLRLLNSSDVFLYEKELSEEDYYGLLGKADIVLLPYSRISYASQTSGIFTESLSLGKVIIVNQGTWMSTKLSENGIETSCNTEDDVMFISMLKDVCANYPKYKKIMRDLSVRWNSYHNPKNFVNELSNLAHL